MAKRIMKREYFDADGNTFSRPTADCIGWRASADGCEPVSAGIDQFPEGIVTCLILAGVNAKIGDSAAQGKDATVEDKFNAMRATFEQLVEGDWVTEAEGGMRTTYVVEAIQRLAAVQGRELEADAVKELLKGPHGDQWRSNPEVREMVATIRLEKTKAETAGKESNLSDLMAQL